MSAEIFEELSRSLINLDERRYLAVLSYINVPLTQLITLEKNNSKIDIVIHELSLSIVKESQLLSIFSKIFIQVLFIQLENAEDTLKILLNQRNVDGRTPLHLGIMIGRKVKNI